jgi:hypothetical protein
MSVHVGRFLVSWSLADDADRSLAATALATLLDDSLEAALEQAVAQCSSDELVAVSAVSVPPITVRRVSDVAEWAGQVSAAVAGAVNAGGPGVVRYRSPAAALTDLVCRSALGDLRREWAWRALGLWPTAAVDPGDGVAAALARWPVLIVPVLEAAAALLLPAALELLGPARLSALAAAAWRDWGAAPARPLPPPAATAPARLTAAVAATRTSALARCAAAALRGEPDGPPAELALALAELLVGHADAAAVRAGSGPEQVALLLATLTDAAAAPPAPVGAGAADPSAASGPEAAAALPPPGAAPSRAGAGPAGAPGEPPGASRPPAEPPEQRTATRTAWAGLLFCLHPLRPVLDPHCRPGAGSVPRAADDLALLDRYGPAAVLHAVGTELCARSLAPRELGPTPGDAALLGFCGRPPHAEPPAADAELAAAAGRLAEAVVAALLDRLADRPLAAVGERELLRTILRRTGAMWADPGWITVDLLLDEVSTDIRAAGLDLDPDWLPGLGCVVRFRYA